MKSLLLSAYNQLEIAEQPTPPVGPTDVLIRVEACGICGSDVHGYDGSSGRRIPPIIMGHEAAGTVAAFGAAVHDLQEGDRVTFDSTVFCGRCEYCANGDVNLCESRQVVGVSCGEYRRNGAFAEYVAVPRHILHHLPDAITFPQAAMLEAVSVALHAVRVSALSGGETALVLGAGMIGLLTLQAAHVAGCSRVFIADVDATRLELARAVGGNDLIHASGQELVAEVLRLTGGTGVDVVFEAVGNDETVSAAIDCTRKGGTVTLIGNIAKAVTLPLQKVVTRQIRLQGSCASAGEYAEAIELIEKGKITVDPLITSVAALEEGPRWFERLHAREPNLMKVILSPTHA
ncbi:zinc-binding dehydrogenase [Acidipila sp. EB88]|uniref:zinc-dependent alcohol dehydrogenase n=1 Tax=Acidipila sp. EB88 TaxID=2305226 RepID=UPI000F5DE505|nr:galactitol-1-phosphate 5-dehydrogenase [Acidipila sp. EB88]RRA49376.1 galactitol-1-phosphate 5-dehydrogenase [Acidipila sp. EB88]